MTRRGIRGAQRTVSVLLDALAHAGRPGEHPLADLLGGELSIGADPLERAIGSNAVADLVTLGLVEPMPDGYQPRARIDRVGPLLVASDLRRHRRATDFVVGPGPASFLLARHVRPHSRGRLLDLGCGSGIQGLLLGGVRTGVLALDINPRAVGYATFNAALNGRRGVRTRLGSFLADEADPDLDRRFETVVANPPFVIAPTHSLVYRDRPLPGDDVTRRTIERVARAVASGGRGYVLGNWIGRGGDWTNPVRDWLADAGLRGAALRIATHDPSTYAAIWTRDLAPPEREAATRTWAAALVAEGIDQIHVGLVAVAGVPFPAGGPRFADSDRTEAASWQALERMLVP